MGMNYSPEITGGSSASAAFTTTADRASYSQFQGVMLVLLSGGNIDQASQTIVSWTSAIYDTTGGIFWSTGLLSSVTIPPSVSVVQFTVHAKFDPEISGYRRIILSGGSLPANNFFSYAEIALISSTGIESHISYETAPVAVTPGDKFNLEIEVVAATGAQSAASGTWMSIHVLG